MSTFTPTTWADVKPGDIVTFIYRTERSTGTRRIRVTNVHEYSDGFARETKQAALRGVFLTKSGQPHKVLNSSWTFKGEGHAESLRLSKVVSVERADEAPADAEAPAPAAAAPAPKAKPLTPAMQSLVHALEERGHVDPVRDFGRCSFNANSRIGHSTAVALINRGILREQHPRFRVYLPATTPEQVWDEAHAEDARRDAEYAAYLADSTNWAQCTPDEDGNDNHTRQTRGGETIVITQGGFRFWYVRVNGHTPMSAGGTFEDARRAADRFEREQAYDAALAEDDARYVGEGRALLHWDETPQERERRATREFIKAMNAAPITPAERITDISDRAAAALDDLAALRRYVKHGPDTVREVSDMMLSLDRIEVALRERR